MTICSPKPVYNAFLALRTHQTFLSDTFGTLLGFCFNRCTVSASKKEVNSGSTVCRRVSHGRGNQGGSDFGSFFFGREGHPVFEIQKCDCLN